MTTANNKRANKMWCVLNCHTGEITTNIDDFKQYCTEVNFEYRKIIKKYANRLKFYQHDYLIWNEPKTATIQTITEQLQYLERMEAMLMEHREKAFDFDACLYTLYKDKGTVERTLLRMVEQESIANTTV